MSKEIISTNKAPQAIGPYSQAVKTGNLIFISGQVPINPQTGDVVSGSIEDQAIQVIQNIQNICEAAGHDLGDIVKLSIFLTDLGNFSIVNEAMKKYLKWEVNLTSQIKRDGTAKFFIFPNLDLPEISK